MLASGANVTTGTGSSVGPVGVRRHSGDQTYFLQVSAFSFSSKIFSIDSIPSSASSTL